LALEIAEKDWTNSVFCAFAKAPIAFGYAGAGLPPVPLLGGMAAISVEMWPTWWWEDLENHLENIGKCGQQFHLQNPPDISTFYSFRTFQAVSRSFRE
jgi:hypothetical protein